MNRPSDSADATAVTPSMTTALFAVFLGAIDLSIIATILPTMVTQLNVNTADIDRYVWIVNAYLIAYIAAIPLAGRLSDLVGRQVVFLGCLALFLIGSVICATAQTLDTMVVARAIQGFGGGGLLPVAMALAGEVFSRRRQLAAIGVIGSVETLGWIIGPTYGAAVTVLSGNSGDAWRWVFWANLPLGLLVALNLRRRVTQTAERRPWTGLRRLDLPGAVLITGFTVCLCLGLTSSGELNTGRSGLRAFGGTPNPLADRLPLLLTGAVVCLTLLGLWTWRARSPLLPRELLGTRGIGPAALGNFLVGTVMMIGIVNVPVIVALLIASENVSWTSAALLAPFTIAIAVTSFLGGRIGARWPQRSIFVAGVALATAGFALLYPSLESLKVWSMIPGLALAGIGVGLVLPPLGIVALAESHRAHYGMAASTLIMARLLGMTIGISALSAVGVYRLQVLTDRLDPVVQLDGESTAVFLARQQEFIIEHAIPLAVQVLQETFALAAALTLLALIPLLRLRESGASQRSDVGGE